MGLIYLTSEIQYLVFGQKIREPDQPVIIPDYFLYIIFSPLIPIGYFLLIFTQFIFRKNQKGFYIFAGGVFLFVFLLLVLIEHIIFGSITLNSLFYIFVSLSFFCVPYFLILYYTLKKEKDMQMN